MALIAAMLLPLIFAPTKCRTWRAPTCFLCSQCTETLPRQNSIFDKRAMVVSAVQIAAQELWLTPSCYPDVLGNAINLFQITFGHWYTLISIRIGERQSSSSTEPQTRILISRLVWDSNGGSAPVPCRTYPAAVVLSATVIDQPSA